VAKKKLIWKLVLVAAALTAVFFPGLSKYHQLKARQQKLNSGIEKLRASEVELLRQQGKLKNDPTYIEKVARDKLQVANKGEIIVRVEEKNGR
jgi:cell division protein DivIC